MLPEYSGPRLKDLAVESEIFEGAKFSECLCSIAWDKVSPIEALSGSIRP